MAFNVGPGATDRGSGWAADGYTHVDLNGPAASANGTATAVELWFETDATGVHVGSCVFNARLMQSLSGAVIGDVTSGSKQTFSGLSIVVYTGNYPCIYWSTGQLSYDAAGSETRTLTSADVVGDASQYLCLVTPNTATLSIQLDCIEAPSVTTSAATNVGTTTATLNGNITSNGGATITERGVCWNYTGNPTTADNTVHDHTNAEGVYSFSATGFPPNKTVYEKAYAINAVNTTYGDQVTFRTFAPAMMF